MFSFAGLFCLPERSHYWLPCLGLFEQPLKEMLLQEINEWDAFTSIIQKSVKHRMGLNYKRKVQRGGLWNILYVAHYLPELLQ